MSWEQHVVEEFKRHDVQFVAYIPDSAVSDLVEQLNEDKYFDTTTVAREEEAVGVLSGAWLAGTRGALVCQSSGLANTFNALGSLSKVTRIPFLGLVTHRGGLDEHNPAHSAGEYPMPQLLDAVGIKNHEVDSPDEMDEYVDMAAKSAFSQEEPFVLLLEPMLFRRDA